MIYILLFIAHLIGDFIFQDSELIKRKQVENAAIIKHSIIYTAFIFAILVTTQELKLAIIVGIIIGILHYVIDKQKSKITKKEIGSKEDFIVFLIDQIVHITLLIIIARYILDLNPESSTLIGQIISKYSYHFVMKISVIILFYTLCANPIGVIIKKVFLIFDTKSEQHLSEETLGAGFVIGILERLIILTLGLLGEFGAIGLVLAAKGLARFEQLKDKNFAEKYLIGTLLSVLLALGCISVIKIMP